MESAYTLMVNGKGSIYDCNYNNVKKYTCVAKAWEAMRDRK